MRSSLATSTLIAAALAASPAAADKIKNPTAVFNGLDKITGRIISFEVAIDETVQFGALQITPRVCYTRPPTEAPNTTTFLEVDEVMFSSEHRRIFSGWMYAASPGLHGIEHAVYDVWLTDCKGGSEVIVEAKEIDPAEDPLKDIAEQQQRDPDQRQRRAGQQPEPRGGRQRVDAGPAEDIQPRPRAAPREAPPQPQQQRPRGFFESLFGR